MTMNAGSPGRALPQDIASQIKQQERQLVLEGSRLGRFDKIRQRQFYSRLLFAPGLGGVIAAGQYQVFSSIAGDTGQGYANQLTLRETNWPSKGRISNNQNLVIKAFHCDVTRPPSDPKCYPAGFVGDINIPTHPVDVQNVLKTCVLGIQFLTNVVPIGKLADFPSVGGAFGWNQSGRQQPSVTPGTDASLDLTPAEAVDSYGNLPTTGARTQAAFERRARVPTLLQHGEQFQMVVIVPRAITLLAQNVNLQGNPMLRDATGCVEIEVGFWATESFVEKS